MLKTTHPKGSNTYGGKLFRRYYNERKKYADLVGLKEKRQKRSSDSLSEEGMIFSPYGSELVFGLSIKHFFPCNRRNG